jgi:hypothetical protein
MVARRDTRLATTLLLIAGMGLMLSGCFSISKYHLGYHHYDDGRMEYDVVSKDSVPESEPFEQACIERFVNYKLESMKPVLAPKIRKKVGTRTLRRLNNKLKKTYGFTGTYERIQLVPRSKVLDEAALKNAFVHYDLVSSNYLLRGKHDAVVQLYMTKVNGELRLSGFEVVAYAPTNPRAKNPPISYIYPESTKKKSGRKGS